MLTVLCQASPSELAEAAEQLRRQEFARLSDAVTPRIEAFRSMTADLFRQEIAAMLERLGHTVVSSVSDIVTTKGGQKFIVACAEAGNATAQVARKSAKNDACRSPTWCRTVDTRA